MVFNDYSLTALRDDDPKRTRVPDNVLLNRPEGYEVLALLQRDYPNVADRQKAERAIRRRVPADLHSRAHIRDSLTRNWMSI
jgi:hypothetical protein